MQLHLYGLEVTQIKVDAPASFCVFCGMITPHPDTIKAWTSLLTVSQSLVDAIEAELKKQQLPKLSWYDALLEIEKAGPDATSPYELKERLLLPQYGTSRLLDRIAQANLIEREDVENDRRGQIIRLTQKGLETRKAMWPVYAGMLMTSIECKLSNCELIEFNRLLGKLAATED